MFSELALYSLLIAQTLVMGYLVTCILHTSQYPLYSD